MLVRLGGWPAGYCDTGILKGQVHLRCLYFGSRCGPYAGLDPVYCRHSLPRAVLGRHDGEGCCDAGILYGSMRCPLCLQGSPDITMPYHR